MPDQIAVGGFEARFYNVKTHIGLVIKEARIKGVNVIATHQPMHVEMLEPGEFEAHIDEQGLAVFLDEKAPGGLKDFEVELQNGLVTAKATATVIVPIRAVAICSLRIVDGRRIYVDLESVDVMGIGASGLVESHLERINPVLDVEELPLDVMLKSVEVDGGLIVLHGTAKPKASL